MAKSVLKYESSRVPIYPIHFSKALRKYSIFFAFLYAYDWWLLQCSSLFVLYSMAPSFAPATVRQSGVVSAGASQGPPSEPWSSNAAAPSGSCSVLLSSQSTGKHEDCLGISSVSPADSTDGVGPLLLPRQKMVLLTVPLQVSLPLENPLLALPPQSPTLVLIRMWIALICPPTLLLVSSELPHSWPTKAWFTDLRTFGHLL